ncbi:MAG: carboxypeptidase-like regulatory domain-containing protein [bacterium]|nr:carboxypeptidase-like regulatory domain-containing protein [bacterium]
MKAAVQRGWVYIIILSIILTGLHKIAYAQMMVKDAAGASASLAAMANIITNMASSQSLLGLGGIDSSSVLAADPSLLIGGGLSLAMGLNPALASFASPSAISNDPLMAASAALLSQSIVAQSMVGLSMAGSGIGGAAPIAAGLGGSSLAGDANLLMNPFSLGAGLFPGLGGALSNISFSMLPSLSLLSSQGKGISPLSALASTLMTIPSLNPFVRPPSLLPSWQQMGGYQYGNSLLGMPPMGSPQMIGALPGGGYGYSGYSPFVSPYILPGGNISSITQTRLGASSGGSVFPSQGLSSPGGLITGTGGTIGITGTGLPVTDLYGSMISSPVNLAYLYTISLANEYNKISIRGVTIFGTVRDQEGEGIGGVTINIYYKGQQQVGHSLISRDSDGYYGQSAVFLGDECSVKIFYEDKSTSYKMLPFVGPTRCDFLLGPGMVFDEITGIPLKGLNVVAIYQANPNLEAQTTTDAEGKYQLFLLPGDYNITIYDNQGSTLIPPRVVKVPSTESKELKFALKLPQFSGKVVDIIDHHPIKNAQIKVIPIANKEVVLPMGDTINTGNMGEFMILLPTGNYQLEITSNGYQKKIIPNVNISGTIKDYLIELTEVEVSQRPKNTPPIITSPKDGQEITVKTGDELCFFVKAQDNENSYLYYTILGPKGWPKLDKVGGESGKEYRYSTTLADLGEYTFEITVSDLGLSTTARIKVVVQYPIQLTLVKGMNLISYPQGPKDAVNFAFDLLSFLGDANCISSIGKYDSEQGVYSKAVITKDRKKSGDNFSISSQEGYAVYAKQPTTINLNIRQGNITSCTLNLKEGINLVGIPAVLGDQYSSHDLLLDLGQDTAISIWRYNKLRGEYEFTYWLGNHPAGVNFPIRIGEGYFIHTRAEKQISLPMLH